MLRFAAHTVFVLLVFAGAAWAATAMWVQLAGPALGLGWGLLALTTGFALVGHFRRRRLGWTVLALSALVTAGWYQSIRPSDTRDWALDVSRGVKARLEGETVHLSDIRDFAWQTAAKAEPRWISRSYRLDQLETVDMLTSVWDSPDIAHLLVSFGFAGGEHIVFSVEIRRESHEAFNELGGFFRQFELVLIGATEGDIVKLRTNHRGEEVSLYPVHLSPEQRRTMFLSYIGLARQLEAQPAFYNTLTANCTTVVYSLAKSLKSDMPLDTRLVFSGKLPEYLADLGVMGEGPMTAARKSAARISPRARAMAHHGDFSRAIRTE